MFQVFQVLRPLVPAPRISYSELKEKKHMSANGAIYPIGPQSYIKHEPGAKSSVVLTFSPDICNSSRMRG